MSDSLWPRDVVGYLVLQRRVRAAAREMRAARRAAPTPMVATVQALLDTLASIDESIDAVLDRTATAEASETEQPEGDE